MKKICKQQINKKRKRKVARTTTDRTSYRKKSDTKHKNYEYTKRNQQQNTKISERTITNRKLKPLKEQLPIEKK